MNKNKIDIKAEKSLSPKLIYLSIILIDIVFVYWAQASGGTWSLLDNAFTYFLVLFGFAFLGLGLDYLNTLVARWYTFMGLTGIAFFTAAWWDAPEWIILAALPLGLVASMINLRGAAVATGFTSLAILLVPRYWLPGIEQPIQTIALVGCWIMGGILVAIYLPIYQLTAWMSEHFEQTNLLLNEARDRKFELERALESLAHANRQLALANKKMASLSEIAEDAQKAKTAFVANVSHEFRTPLNMITGLIELMMRTPENYDVILSPKMREDFNIIYRNCEHLSNMVNDVLDLTRVETGRLVLYREWVDPNEIINKSITVVRPLLAKKNLEMVIDVAGNLPQIYCDRMRVQQVVLNLLSNAARFTEHGQVTIQARIENQRLKVNVSDTGPGIYPEDQERIFEPFWQGRDPIWQKKGGSGIGLSLSREFVNLHGGMMWFESQPGQGSSFFFTLPITKMIEPVSKVGSYIKEDWMWKESVFIAARASAADEIIKPRVILYDKTESLYPRFSRLSDKVEFFNIDHIDQVVHEGNAKAIILNAPSVEQVWPMIETALSGTATTPVIGCSVPGEYQRALELGARGYLIKPIKMEDLQRTLASISTPVGQILIVDDDAQVLDLYKRMLQNLDPGLTIATASCGQEALDFVRSQPPDLMFLDVIMPEMNGWEVLETISREVAAPLFPIYFITAQDPVDHLSSNFILATIKGGIPLGKLLNGSLEIASLIMESEREPDPVNGQNFAD